MMESGQSFEEFTLGCAHAFGALVMLRDEPLDAPISEFKPSPYYAEALAEHQNKLSRLQAMSEDERLAYGEAEKAQFIEKHEKWLAKDIAENERLAEMREAVLAWTPPSPGHEELKKFMLQQIEVSMNGLGYIQKEIAAAKSRPPLQFWRADVAAESHGVQCATEEQAKEIERVQGSNLWVKQLRDSMTVNA